MGYSEQDVANVEKILETNNFYEILELPFDATEEQVKAAHKKKALLVHPDKNNAPRAKDAFCSVRRATAILLDKNRRKDYDAYLRSPTGFCKENFDLSDDAIDAILITAGVGAVVGIAAGLFALFNWLTSPKKEESEPKHAR